jgi:hypothetical protein
MENFPKMQHFPNQDVRVTDEEKAMKMAEAQSAFENMAANLNDFQNDPTLFASVHSATEADELELLNGLSKEGITPADLREVGDRYAEARGVAHDYAQEVRQKSFVGLRVDYFVNGFSLIKSQLVADVNIENTRHVPPKLSRRDALIKAYAALMRMEIADREMFARFSGNPELLTDARDQDLLHPGTWKVRTRD